ncbi:MAG TPA: TIGR00282 family metallophosphoesterase [Thermohalobaculum sp.]|nr:TIGR00282 family metallophosphoesterase [Thermohalobaculum sp.]
MRLLFLGDLVGRAGRTAVIEALPKLRADWKLDFVAVNAENAASGFGLTPAIADALFAAGADCLTLGDHAFDQKEMIQHIEREPRILRPLNYGRAVPGRGSGLFEAGRGRKVLVAVALGRVFMNRPFEDPFSALDAALKVAPLGAAADAVLVEMHAEATSEKMAVGHWCDGRASLVVGSHTHVPTADAMILPKGTAYQSDAGMCGDYDSVIGMEKSEPLRRFITGMANGRFEPAMGEPSICGVYLETDDRTGLASRIAPVRLQGKLDKTSAPN